MKLYIFTFLFLLWTRENGNKIGIVRSVQKELDAHASFLKLLPGFMDQIIFVEQDGTVVTFDNGLVLKENRRDRSLFFILLFTPLISSTFLLSSLVPSFLPSFLASPPSSTICNALLLLLRSPTLISLFDPSLR